jgi:hypothetical protein
MAKRKVEREGEPKQRWVQRMGEWMRRGRH